MSTCKVTIENIIQKIDNVEVSLATILSFMANGYW